MKFSEKWLKEWIPVSLDTQALCEQLTMAGLEVDSVENVSAELQNVVCAKVVQTEPHPKKKHLTICKIEFGDQSRATVVCGATNVVRGKCYAYAGVGAKIDGNVISAKNFAGVDSQGMLCSAQDMGMEEKSMGVLALDKISQCGQDLNALLGLDDKSIEIDLTPNRGDCLSIRGIARELGILNAMELLQADIPKLPPASDTSVNIQLQAPQACPRYVGRIIEGVNSKAATPLWMIEKLRRSGLRSLGAVVDVTNFVMLELGQPMHAFDLSKIQQGIIVREARHGEKLELLNGQSVDLHAGTLVIADEQKPLAMAGIMGGADSAVSEQTQDILLESAFFSPELLAGKARQYGLHTDSSHRFERHVDSELQAKAIERATALLLDIVGGRPGPVLEVCSLQDLPRQPTIELRYARVKKILGCAPQIRQIQDWLVRLSPRVKYDEAQQTWRVQSPSYRPDIQLEVDLIEEIARIYGYQNIPENRPYTHIGLRPVPEQSVPERRIAQLLMDRGYNESINYSFTDVQIQKLLHPDLDPLALANPLSEEMAAMRTSLWAGLIKACLYNLNRQQSRIRLFEIGLKYLRQGADIKQVKHVAGLATGTALPQSWRKDSGNLEFFQFKSDFLALLGLTGRAQDFIFSKVWHKALHPGQSAQIEFQGETVGSLGSISPQVLSKLEIGDAVFVFELDLTVFQHCRTPQFQEVTKFPTVRRDLAFVVDCDQPAERYTEAIREVAGDYLFSLGLIDVYQGEKVQKGKKSLAFSLQLQHLQHTLTDNEVETITDKIVKYLKEQHQATLRE